MMIKPDDMKRGSSNRRLVHNTMAHICGLDTYAMMPRPNGEILAQKKMETRAYNSISMLKN